MTQNTEFIKDPQINEVLEKMWRLNNDLAMGRELNTHEYEYWNKYLPVIKVYYENNNKYWSTQTTK